MQHSFKHRMEYAALRVVQGCICILPYRLALLLGWVFAWVAFHLIRFRRDLAENRIREVFGDRYPAAHVRQIAWISLRNLFFSTVELLRVPRITNEWIQKVTDYSETQWFWEQADVKRGGVFAIPHMGNWDLSGIGAKGFGIPIFIITGSQRNVLVNNHLNRMRGYTGVEAIVRDDPQLSRKVMKRLKSGGFLGIMTDLRSKKPGIQANFLGREANLVPGMAVYAQLARVPVYPVIVTRVGWARHRWRAFQPIEPDRTIDRQEDWKRMTQQVIDIYEKAIREEPEQFFWYNKRWVLDPLEPVPTRSET